MARPVKSILVTHAPPTDDNSPYSQLAQQFNLRVDFQNFVDIVGVPTPEFRKQSINPLDFSAFIFTSKFSIDHTFRICKDLRIELPAETKYFCINEATAKYLQKYIVIRKRKLFVGDRTAEDLLKLFKKHPKETYLLPGGESPRQDIINILDQHSYNYRLARVYETIYADLKEVLSHNYDILCFFSPASLEALYTNLPDFNQGKAVIATFGTATRQYAGSRGLDVAVEAPTPEFPSLAMALEDYLRSTK
jgi:uroporphyrinogen-III synthase